MGSGIGWCTIVSKSLRWSSIITIYEHQDQADVMGVKI